MPQHTVYFKNKGLIDLEAITTFGINAKVTVNPIGYFGTGLKYAIANILARNGKIIIYRGKERYFFSASNLNIRNKDFNRVEMNGNSIGFTTELGKGWEEWMAYRELRCNAFDEQEPEVSITPLKPEHNYTLIVVKDEATYIAHSNAHLYFLSSKPIAVSQGIEIHEKGLTDSVFYRGICVGEASNAIFTYNIIDELTLTEDRTVRYSWILNERIVNALAMCTDEYVLERFIRTNDTYETGLNISKLGDTLLALLDSKSFKDHGHAKLRLAYRAHVAKAYYPETKDFSPIQQKQLQKAIAFCKKIGFNVDQYPIFITDDLQRDALGMAYRNTIFLSEKIFHQGTKQVAATLLEEWIHLSTGYLDETYALQTHLFDIIMSLGEQIQGEPI